MVREKYTQQIWILLAESFPTVVSKVSQPLWFVKKLIFCRLVLDVQSSCMNFGIVRRNYVGIVQVQLHIPKYKKITRGPKRGTAGLEPQCTHMKNNFRKKQKVYDDSEITIRKLSARRLQICFGYFCKINFQSLFSK